jgi:hypothetical protein
MTAVFCRNSVDRSGAGWQQQLAPFVALEFAVSDAAKGIASGLEGVARQRRAADDMTPLAQGLDLFHTAREARGVLHRAWQGAEAAWVKAEAFDVRVAASKRQGLDARGVAKAAAAAWRRAVRAWRMSKAGRGRGVGPGRPWTCSTPRVGSTTGPEPRRRSPRPWRT